MYIEKLRERDRRKTVVKELGLVEAFFKVVRLHHTWPSRTILSPINAKLNLKLLAKMTFMWECHSWNGTCIFSLIRKILWTRQLVSCLHLSRRKEIPGLRSLTGWKCLTEFRLWLLSCDFAPEWVCLPQGIEEHKKLIASVTKEKELKTRIKELIR